MIKYNSNDGRFYPSGYQIKSNKANTSQERIRKTGKWKRKSEEIRERDHYMCVACFNNVKGTERQYEYDNLSVHHIIPLKINMDLAYEDGNLITLCRTHHDMAERGELSVKLLQSLIEDKLI